ncbi:hypothetical protein D5R40_09600 [Okeania hirsuta]|uniref:Uncharacterized protein n=1 Tax=Okeania hirsuta TaxID=1458930 RepID=A0A3N6RKH2_9CYAN|nr:hypothetical protein D4Z78_17700 [Okeania hirsuta]RQH46693.1 hypothetical protein D5R40_09600 [Okeania hirsuta]
MVILTQFKNVINIGKLITPEITVFSNFSIYQILFLTFAFRDMKSGSVGINKAEKLGLYKINHISLP